MPTTSVTPPEPRPAFDSDEAELREEERNVAQNDKLRDVGEDDGSVKHLWRNVR